MNEWMSKQRIHDGIQLEIRKTLLPQKVQCFIYHRRPSPLIVIIYIFISFIISSAKQFYPFFRPPISLPLKFKSNQFNSYLRLAGYSIVNQEGHEYYCFVVTDPPHKWRYYALADL